MRVIVPEESGAIRCGELPVPEPSSGEVRLRVRACGLCGSDLHLHHLGLYTPGVVPGHEIAGVVDAVGPDVEEPAPGTSVAVEPLHGCGRCAWCREGRDPLCPEGAIYGVHRHGGFAEQVVVPARRCFALPPDLEPAVGALAEPLAVSLHGLRRAALEPGQRVLVLGAGSVGLLTLAAARWLGAGSVWISARHAHQAELARALGADRVLGEDEASPEALAALTPAEAPHAVVETVGGRADTAAAAVAALRPGGTVSVLGLFTGRVALPPASLFAKEATLAWSNCYVRPPAAAGGRADFAEAVAMLDAERERLAPLCSHGVPLAEAERAWSLAADKAAGVIKVTVLP